MKTKINYLLVFLGCMLIFPLTSNAQCSYERQAELSRIAANVQFSYTYEIENNVPIFTANITNLTNDIYMVDSNNNAFNNVSEVSKQYYDNDRTIGYTIYSNDNSCRGEKLLTKYINFPFYNIYNTYQECKDNPGYQYCGMWVDTFQLSVDDFEKGLEQYADSNTIAEENDMLEENTLTKMLDFAKHYYYIVLAILILIIAVIVNRKLKVIR